MQINQKYKSVQLGDQLVQWLIRSNIDRSGNNSFSMVVWSFNGEKSIIKQSVQNALWTLQMKDKRMKHKKTLLGKTSEEENVFTFGGVGVRPSLMGEVMPKVRESSLAEIQRAPFLHGRWVSAVGGSGFLQRASAAGVGVHVTTLGGVARVVGCKTEVGYPTSAEVQKMQLELKSKITLG